MSGSDVPWPEEWPRRSGRAVLGAVGGLPLGGLMLAAGVPLAAESPPTGFVLLVIGWLLAMASVFLPMLQPSGPGRSREHVRSCRLASEQDPGPGEQGVLIPVSRPIRWARAALCWPLGLAVPLSLLVLWQLRTALPVAVILVWLAVVLVAGGWLLVLVIRAVRRPYSEGLLLGEQGITVQHPTRRWFVAWSRLLGFVESFETQGSQWLVIPLCHDEADTGRPRSARRELRIVANRLAVDPGLIPATLRFYLDNPAHRGELASDAGVRRIRTADYLGLDARAREHSRQLRIQELEPYLSDDQPGDDRLLGDEQPSDEQLSDRPGNEPVGDGREPEESPEATTDPVPDAIGPVFIGPDEDAAKRPRVWRMWSPTALWAYWTLQVGCLLVGAIVALGYGIQGSFLDVGSDGVVPLAFAASAVVLIPAGTLGLVLIRAERLRTAQLTRDAEGTTIRPSRTLRRTAWWSIGVIVAGLIGPIALLASYWTTAGPAAATGFGWAFGCGFVAWPALSGLRKVLRGVRADDLLRLGARELIWRSGGHETRVAWQDVLSITPSIGGHGSDPCIRIGTARSSTDLLLPWRFLTAGPMRVRRALLDHARNPRN